MKQCIIYFLLFTSFSSFGQYFDLDYFDVDSTICAADENQQIYFFKNWELYQTLDNTWNGERDNSLCINLGREYLEFFEKYRYGIDLTTINPDKAVFLRYKMEDQPPVLLDPNFLYFFVGSMFAQQQMFLNFDDTCPDGLCSGIISILEIEEDGESALRQSNFPFTPANQCAIYSCFVTEKTMTNRMDQVIFKFTLTEESPLDPLILSTGAQMEAVTWPDIEYIEEDISIGTEFFDGTNYSVNIMALGNGWYESPYLVKHIEKGLPSIDNQSIIYLGPEENTEEPQTINLIIEEYQNLYYQWFSHLKGAQVQGSDSIHHTLNIVSSSLDMCIAIVERIHEDNTNFVYQGGHIEFMDQDACLQFRNNSKLVIGKGKHLNFGESGVGNLNLRSGSTIQFDEGASMHIDGNLIITPYYKFSGDKKIYVDLKQGTKLSFGENARIYNPYGNLKLNVRMKGGNLDISALSAEDQQKVNIIYPEPNQPLKEMVLFPNPTHGDLVLYNPLQSDLISIRLLDSRGVLTQTIHLNNRDIEHKLNLENVCAGLHYLVIEKIDGVELHKILIQD